jgi:hypothetical protein
MNDTYKSLKKDLLQVNKTLSTLLSDIQNLPDNEDSRFEDWQRACSDIHNQISEEVVRVAVIGPVKSGKSTLANSLFKGDYLKRGAGIVTSIVTRIRSNDSLRAVLTFKSWDEINAEIERALVMLPTWDRQGKEAPFDIRNDSERQLLSLALKGLSDEMLFTDGTRNVNSILLTLYLEGYDKVNKILVDGPHAAEFTGNDFQEHHSFVGDDAMAVYLKDIELEISSSNLDRSIEIADCQGSDSPNPLHLAMIQEYLMKTHFIVYVISSRTGLREADIRFLSMIKKMGILGNMLFVANIDFSEHDSLEDVERIIAKIRDELSLIRPDPDIYTFSALFNLFSNESVELSKKDSLRMTQWMNEESMTALSNSETRRFEMSLNEKLTRERFELLLINHLERMRIISSGIDRWSSINMELLKKDVQGASSMIQKISHHEKRIEQIRDLLRNTFKGTTEKMLRELKSEIDRFFGNQPEGVLGQALGFMRNYTVNIDKYREKLSSSGFNKTLYVVFQEFKQALDKFMAETLDPEIVSFCSKVDKRIGTSLESVAEPYESMASDTVSELKAAMSSVDAESGTPYSESRSLLDMDILKQRAGLSLPSTTAVLQYSTKVRTEAVMRLGYYSVKKLIKKALKKEAEKINQEQMLALADGLNLIKKDTEESMIFHFENYRENFKFQYVAKLINAATEYLHQLLTEKFQSCNADIKALERIAEKQGSEREQMLDFLIKASAESKRIQAALSGVRKRLASPVGQI